MAKYFNGSINFPSALKPTGAQPLDDRAVVKTFDELIAKDTFVVNGASAAYPGMRVTVIADNKLYILKGVEVNGKLTCDPTKAENWVPAGSNDVSGDIDSLNGRVDNLEDRMRTAEGKLDNIEYPVNDVQVNGESVVENGVANITIDTGLTKDDVQDLIDSSFNKFVSDVTDNKTVDTFKELVEYAAEHESEIGDLVKEVDKKIESISVNGVDATVTNGKAVVSIEADDIELGSAITSDGEAAKEDESNVVHKANAKLNTVLQGIYNSISGAEAGGVHAVVAADKSVVVNSADKNNPTVKVQISNSANNMLSLDDNGLFVAMYYEGDDE